MLGQIQTTQIGGQLYNDTSLVGEYVFSEYIFLYFLQKRFYNIDD